MEASVGGHLGDVEAGDDRGAVGTVQLPGEAQLVAEAVDAAGAGHPEAREPGVDAGDHLDELGVAGGVGVLVDVAAVGRERLGDERGALVDIGGAPHLEVGVDERGGVGGGGVCHAAHRRPGWLRRRLPAR